MRKVKKMCECGHSADVHRWGTSECSAKGCDCCCMLLKRAARKPEKVKKMKTMKAWAVVREKPFTIHTAPTRASARFTRNVTGFPGEWRITRVQITEL